MRSMSLRTCKFQNLKKISLAPLPLLPKGCTLPVHVCRGVCMYVRMGVRMYVYM